MMLLPLLEFLPRFRGLAAAVNRSIGVTTVIFDPFYASRISHARPYVRLDPAPSNRHMRRLGSLCDHDWIF
jgi:hypothetical protein